MRASDFRTWQTGVHFSYRMDELPYFEDGYNLQMKTFNFILYIIHKTPIVQQVFHEWVELTAQQRGAMNMVLYDVPDEGLYGSIISGFVIWSLLQDMEGAVGYHDGYNPNYTMVADEQFVVTRSLLIMRTVMAVIKLKMILCFEIETFNVNDLQPLNRRDPAESMPKLIDIEELELPEKEEKADNWNFGGGDM
ncbi:uncharacterized protein LOC109604360 [Aethina tumida]|uniref:uncharacterized protein LOC109604360 n=1 Tax=Aethina tumida TaxID=116153 RepID=UPI0021479A71|nr:uncharacterized protein LOC109604360 [Aethina tumida]